MKTLATCALWTLALGSASAAQCELDALEPTFDPERFGSAIDTESGWLAVGARYGDANRGSVRMYIRQGDDYAFTEELTRAGGSPDDGFGRVLDVDGDLMSISAPDRIADADGRRGVAWVYERIDQAWVSMLAIPNPEAAQAIPSGFGKAIAMSGTRVAVGAPNDDESGIQAGAVHIWEETTPGMGWARTDVLVPPDPTLYQAFGASLAWEDDVLIVGAPGDNDKGYNAGAVYVYDLAAGSISKRTAPEGSAQRYGESVAIDRTGSSSTSHRFVVGAPTQFNQGIGRAYVTSRSGGTFVIYTEEGELDGGQIAGDAFGSAIAIEGQRILVGARLSDVKALSGGEAHAFQLRQGGWVRSAALKTVETGTSSGFGSDVALDGSEMLVAGPFDDSSSGTVARFSLDPELCPQACDGPRLPLGPAYAFGELGSSLDTTGEYVVVGSPFSHQHASFSGAARVLHREDDCWSVDGDLVSAEVDGNDELGAAVAIDGKRVIVGMPGDEGFANDAGRAQIWQRESAGWQQVADFLPIGVPTGGGFGSSVDIRGDWAMVAYDAATSGIVNAYNEASPANWIQRDTLVASSYHPGDGFGDAIAMYGDRVAIGAPTSNAGAPAGGAVHVFQRWDNDWLEQQVILPQGLQAGARFGASIAFEGNLMVIGAPDANGSLFGEAGLAYVYENVYKPISGQFEWELQQVLEQKYEVEAAHFGASVSIDGDAILVGAPVEAGSYKNGTVHVFEPSGGVWQHVDAVNAPGAKAGDRFGASVARRDGTLFAGAPGLYYHGAAFALDLEAPTDSFEVDTHGLHLLTGGSPSDAARTRAPSTSSACSSSLAAPPARSTASRSWAWTCRSTTTSTRCTCSATRRPRCSSRWWVSSMDREGAPRPSRSPRCRRPTSRACRCGTRSSCSTTEPCRSSVTSSA